MDELDKRILQLLAEDARMTVKDIASKILLTSPAVSQRIKRMEETGIIKGYTAVLGESKTEKTISAIINISVQPKDTDKFFAMLNENKHIRRCHHVTGNYSYILIVRCTDMEHIEKVINEFQQLGLTNTQIVLSTPLDRYSDVEIMF